MHLNEIVQNRILIITGGTVEDEFLISLLQKTRYHMMLAVDFGLCTVDRLGLKPDYILGDFDSVTESVLKKYQSLSTPIKTFPKEKDKTDTEIAIELALMHHPTAIDIIGGTGSRLDHVLANVHLLRLPLQLGIQACLMDSHNKIYLMDQSFRINKTEQFGDYISLLPYGDKVMGLTLTGFRYPLDHITYNSGSSLGISNVIIEDSAAVEFSQGILLVIESKD